MQSILTSIFDAGFGVRCFLPSLLVIIGSFLIHDIFSGPDQLSRLLAHAQNSVEALAGSAFIFLLASVGGVVISAIQRELIRFLEGYGSLNPLNSIKYFKNAQLKEFNGLMKTRDDLCHCLNSEKKLSSNSCQLGDARSKVADELDKVALILSERFPAERNKLLPTSFGNAMRALEDYPEQMYGLDGVTGWTRLEAVIPREFQDLVNETRLYRDFWVNILFASIFLLLDVAVVSVSTIPRPFRIICAGGALILLGAYAYLRATDAACRFGSYARSAFDLYIDDLREKLKIPKSSNPEEQRLIWRQATSAYTYRRPDLLDRVHLDDL